MASKKYTSLIVLLCLLVSTAFSQQEGTYTVQDSSVIPSKRLPQHTEFMANNYAYPAMPRNQWELGLKLGVASISGDVRAQFPGYGGALHIRKALGYVFSLRGEVAFMRAKGLNFQPSNNYLKNPAWAPYYGITPVRSVFYNYRTTMWDFTLQGVFTLNNIRFHRAKSGFNVYGFAGLGAQIFNAKIDALNGTTPYDFSSVINTYGPTSFQHSDRRDIKSDLKDIFDGDYETDAEEDNGKPDLFDKQFMPIMTGGAGVQFKLSRKISLGIEDRFNVIKSDLVDGQQWQENDANPARQATAQTRDFDLINFLSVGLNFSLGGKSVEPLWWLNPLDYAYNEINQPKHMKLPKPILDDADADGVTDQFDLEPNTPPNTPVDTHGVSRDTDGDGVPDSKDKELITPTQCQPVDADGVGKCPDPACCDELRKLIDSGGLRPNCNIGDLPSITFRGNTVALTNDARALLSSVAQKIRDNANCKIAVIGYCASSKSQQQLSWDRVNAVINHLVDREGISADRFIWKYGQEGGDCNTIDLRDGTGEEGPSTVPAPHPNLRRRG